ncbi:MAG: hypothetical protein IPH31_14475 [Lewinellaceae bacterium]|nr:hypothetical protein [Lewinellaceae bacterium]
MSGREFQSFCGHTGAVSAVAFSPDGKQVLTGSRDNTAKVWDLSGHQFQSFQARVPVRSFGGLFPRMENIY